MKDNKKILIILVVAFVLIIINIYSVNNDLFMELRNVNAQLRNLEMQLNNMTSDMENLKSNIEEELESQSSILSSYNISYDNGDSKTLMGDIIIKLVPKEYSQDTTATITLGDKVVNMEREGSTFTAAISAPVDIIYSEFIVDFKSGASMRSEVVAPGDIGFVNVLSNDINVDFYGEGSKDINNKYGFHGQVQIYMEEVDKTLLEVKLFAIKNDEVIWETKDFYHNEEQNNYTTEINKSFSLEKEDRLHLSVEIKDSYGFIYRTPIYNTEINGNDGITGASENMTPQVYDAEGKAVVFKNY